MKNDNNADNSLTAEQEKANEIADQIEENEDALLRSAAHRNGAAKVGLLVLGVKVDCRDHHQRTPLMLAARYGTHETVDTLLGAKADVHTVDEDGWTPLMWAAEAGNAGAVEKLLAAGANPSAKNKSGLTVLMVAAGSKLGEPTTCVKDLLAAGADANELNSAGSPALAYAARQGISGPSVVELLAKVSTNLSATGSGGGLTPLVWAISRNDAPMVRALVTAGTDVHAPDDYGVTPLLCAAESTDPDILPFLIQSGASIDVVDNQGLSPLHRAARRGQLKNVRLLIKLGCDVNATDRNGITPLMAATMVVEPDVARELLGAGANVHATGQNGETALGHATIIATRSKNTEMYELLISAGAVPASGAPRLDLLVGAPKSEVPAEPDLGPSGSAPKI